MRIFGSNYGDKKIRTNRIAIINSGTSGTVTLPANATVILDSFGADGVGGLLDAALTKVISGEPSWGQVLDGSSNVLATTFNSSGDYTLSGTPASYPIGLIYTVETPLFLFDSEATDIVGPPVLITSYGGFTASRALVSNSLGVPTTSNVTATELSYVSGVTSAIQRQIDDLNDQSVHFLFMGAGG